MMKVIDNIVRGLMKPVNPTLIIVLGGYTVIWGLWLINPFWSVFAQSALWSAMAVLAPEAVWGAVAIIIGLFTIRGAVLGGYHQLHFGSFVACMFWLFCAICFFAGNWMGTGGITALCFATYAGLVWLNVKINKRNYMKKRE